MEWIKNIFKREQQGPWILTISWVLFVTIVNPIGDFPINDDWAYALNVYSLSENNELSFSNWPAMTLLTQTFIGASVCKIFGFSFTVLRITTLIFALFSMLLAYRIVLLRTSNYHLALIAGILLLFNPIFLSLSMTFMTEIYYIFFTLLSLWFTYSFFQTNRWDHYLLILISLALLLLIRQTGLIWFIAFSIVAMLRAKSKIDFLKASFPVLFAIILLRAYMSFRSSHPDGLGNYNDSSILADSISQISLGLILSKISSIAYYLGIFLIPISLLTYRFVLKKIKPKQIISYLVALILPTIMIYHWDNFPNGNIINENGLGVYLIKDLFFHVNNEVLLGDPFFTFMRLISIGSIFILGLFILAVIHNTISSKTWNEIRINPDAAFSVLLIVGVLGILAYLFLNPVFFDRYTLEISIILGLVLIKFIETSRLKVYLSISVLAGSFLISSLLIHDYMNWGRSKIEAINFATNLGGSPSTIDGGLEYGGWNGSAFGGNLKDINQPMSWVLMNDDFVVSNGLLLDYQTIKMIPTNAWISPIKNVSLLRKSFTSDGIDHRKYPVKCTFDSNSIKDDFFTDNSGFAIVNVQNKIDRKMPYSGNQCLKLDAKSKELPSLFIRDLKLNEHIEASVMIKGAQNGHLVIQTVGDFTVYKLGQIKGMPNNWEKVKLEINVSEDLVGRDLKIFLWNPSDNEVFYDDLFLNRSLLLPIEN